MKTITAIAVLFALLILIAGCAKKTVPDQQQPIPKTEAEAQAVAAESSQELKELNKSITEIEDLSSDLETIAAETP